MKKPFFTSALRAFIMPACLFLAPSLAWGERPQCDFPPFPPPSGSGPCFIDGRLGGVFFEDFSEDLTQEPDQMVLILFNDRDDDFVRVSPHDDFFVHTPEREATMIWCPFPFADFDENGPAPDCIMGAARLAANGFVDENVDPSCPYTAHMSGTGSDFESGLLLFDVSFDTVRVPSRKDPSGCKILKNEIIINPR